MFFDVDGLEARSRPDGPEARPTMICLHGGPGVDHSIFKPFLAPLADVAQVVYLDLRGNGRTDRSSPDHWNLATWGADIGAFCDAVGVDKPIVFGHSFGAAVALAYATQFPDHPAGLLLSGTTGTIDRGSVAAAFGRLGGPTAEVAAAAHFADPLSVQAAQAFEDICIPLYLGDTDFGEALRGVITNDEVREHYAAHEAMIFDFTESTGLIRCPTLIVAGSNDPFCPPDTLERFASGFAPSSATTTVYPNVGHAPYRDATTEFVAEAIRFVASIGPSG